MAYEPIKTLEVENYGCIKRAAFELTPLHAFIGPNDSGKSTTLRALRTVTQLAAGQFGPNYRNEPFDAMMGESADIAFSYRDALKYRFLVNSGQRGSLEMVFSGGEVVSGPSSRNWFAKGMVRDAGRQERPNPLLILDQRVTTATLVRFDPDSLRSPSKLIPENEGIRFADEKGMGLASVFDAIINRDAGAFAEIQSDLRKLFPNVAKLGLMNVSDSFKEVAVTLSDGTRVGAKAMSEGLLYYLGFAALRHVTGSRLFLVEEPENGLHPARVAEVMSTLRKMSETSQVVIATHSPLVVNELKGNEITVITRDPVKGTQGVLLQNVPGYREAAKVYQPGEFWLSYADGNREEPLLTGTPRV